MAAQAGLFSAGAAPSREALQAAQARLMRDETLQFSFSAAPAPPKPTPTPPWLLDFERFVSGVVKAIGPYVGWVFVAGLALALGVVLFFIGREIIRSRWPGLFKRRPAKRLSPVDWRPEASAARALLEEADRLAAAGAYSEAAHLLLYRSIEDIEGRRPRLVRPAYTAREIGGLEGLPPAARSTFQAIALAVEKSFFGGRALDAAGFAECRRAYEAFAFHEAWA